VVIKYPHFDNIEKKLWLYTLVTLICLGLAAVILDGMHTKSAYSLDAKINSTQSKNYPMTIRRNDSTSNNLNLYPIGSDLVNEHKQIAVTHSQDGNLALFSLDLHNSGIYYKYQLKPHGNWSKDWIDLGPIQSKQIAVGNNKDGRLVLTSLDLNGSVSYKYQLRAGSPSGNWSNWINLGSQSKQIAVGNNKDGRLVIFTIGIKYNVPYYKYELNTNGINWNDNWIDLGPIQSKQIAVGNNKDGRLALFSIGLDDNVTYYKYQLLPNDVNWSNRWISLGLNNIIASKQIAVGNNKDGRLVIFSISDVQSNLLNYPYYKYQITPGDNWSNDWRDLVNIGTSRQVIVSNSKDGTLVLFQISGDTNEVNYYELQYQPLPLLRDHTLKIEELTNGLSYPTSMAFIDTTKILVLEKNNGNVRLVSNGVLQQQPVLHVHVNGSAESGLVGIAVINGRSNADNIAMNNKSSSSLLSTDHNAIMAPLKMGRDNATKTVFLYFKESQVDGGKPLGNRVYKYQWNGTALINPKLILDLPGQSPEHNGGKLAIGSDGNLYVVIGDQHMNTSLQNLKNGSEPNDTGVVLRLTPDGLPVSDNPFIKVSSDKMKKIFAYGIRNSFGLAIDPITGDIWDTENGVSNYDEINHFKPGYNSGWKQVVGPISRSNKTTKDLVSFPGSRYIDPVFSWKATVAPTQIEFLKSSRLGHKYTNSIFVGDFDNGNLYNFEVNKNRTGLSFSTNQTGLYDLVSDNPNELLEVIFGTHFGGITDIKTGPDGFLYVLTYNGNVYRIIPNNESIS
jgi:aldose sugar dehydrogenase